MVMSFPLLTRLFYALIFPIEFKLKNIFSGKIYSSQVLRVIKPESHNVYQQLLKARTQDSSYLFNQYYMPCHKSLALYCMGILKDFDLAENAASDTLVKFLEFKKPETIKNFEGWLFTIARNTCLTYLNKHNRRREILDDVGSGFAKQQQAKGEQKLIQQDIDKLISETLNTKELNIWKLHLNGFNNDEISAELDIPGKTVANLKSQARNKLKHKLKNHATS